MKLLIKKRSDRLKNRSKSPVKIQLSLGRFSIKIPNFGKIFLDFLSNSCSGDPPSSSREEGLKPAGGIHFLLFSRRCGLYLRAPGFDKNKFSTQSSVVGGPPRQKRLNYSLGLGRSPITECGGGGNLLVGSCKSQNRQRQSPKFSRSQSVTSVRSSVSQQRVGSLV